MSACSGFSVDRSPQQTTIRYTIRMPENGGLEGKDTEEIALPRPVLSTVGVVRLEGFEPPTPGSEDRCSIH